MHSEEHAPHAPMHGRQVEPSLAKSLSQTPHSSTWAGVSGDTLLRQSTHTFSALRDMCSGQLSHEVQKGYTKYLATVVSNGLANVDSLVLQPVVSSF